MASLTDVAAKAEVSVSTASSVLNPGSKPKFVSESVGARVRDAARESDLALQSLDCRRVLRRRAWMQRLQSDHLLQLVVERLVHNSRSTSTKRGANLVAIGHQHTRADHLIARHLSGTSSRQFTCVRARLLS